MYVHIYKFKSIYWSMWASRAQLCLAESVWCPIFKSICYARFSFFAFLCFQTTDLHVSFIRTVCLPALCLPISACICPEGQSLTHNVLLTDQIYSLMMLVFFIYRRAVYSFSNFNSWSLRRPNFARLSLLWEMSEETMQEERCWSQWQEVCMYPQNWKIAVKCW